MINSWPTTNGYWIDDTIAGPWWLARTKYGIIRIGWRKRVVEIDWSDTPVRGLVTKDQVTKDQVTKDQVTSDVEMVHAYGYAKCVEYLRNLKDLFNKYDFLGDRHEEAIKENEERSKLQTNRG